MQFQGELKKQWGKFTDDYLQQIEGNLRQRPHPPPAAEFWIDPSLRSA
jgi:hypothetical protein